VTTILHGILLFYAFVNIDTLRGWYFYHVYVLH